MLKILQARLQQYVNWELPGVQAGFRKGRTIDQLANIQWIIEKARELKKKSTSTSLAMLKPLNFRIRKYTYLKNQRKPMIIMSGFKIYKVWQ